MHSPAPSLRAAQAAAVVLALAACAAQPAPATAPTAFGGTWVVTDAFPAGAVTDMTSAPMGQRVRMDAAMAGDVAGRACPWPVYREGRGPLAVALGTANLSGDTATLEVDCAGQRMAAYAIMTDGSLLTRHGPWLIRLEHGEKLAANPAPMAPETPMALAAPAMPVEPSPPPAPRPVAEVKPPTLVYLASYRTDAWAKKGWGILAGHSASLKELTPVTRSVELKDKGKFVRLFAPAKDADGAKRICTELGKAISDCGAAGRDK